MAMLPSDIQTSRRRPGRGRASALDAARTIMVQVIELRGRKQISGDQNQQEETQEFQNEDCHGVLVPQACVVVVLPCSCR